MNIIQIKKRKLYAIKYNFIILSELYLKAYSYEITRFLRKR